MQQNGGYYQYPSIHADQVVFVSEGDLWKVPASGGIARRLTSGLGDCSHSCLSPDGKQLAFTATEEGHFEVFVCDAEGGELKRLTYLGAQALVVGWLSESEILFASTASQPFGRNFRLFKVNATGGQPVELPFGNATRAVFGPNGETVLCRSFFRDMSHWKRYRGGTAGVFWVDKKGDGEFKKLEPASGNLDWPMFVDGKFYFLADHEGVGNLYSCDLDGQNIKRHTKHSDYYARQATTDGKSIVYSSGADLYLLDPSTGENKKIAVEYHSPRTLRRRKFVSAEDYLEAYSLNQKGDALALVARGNSYTMDNWSGPVFQQGEGSQVRYRLPVWFNDGKRLALISDEGGEEKLEIHHCEQDKKVEVLKDLNIGHPTSVRMSPCEDKLALTNHRSELIVVDLKEKSMQTLDRSSKNRIRGFDWSPDGRWIAYSFAKSSRLMGIKIADLKSGECRWITQPVYMDLFPSFDPEGQYLYFMSARDFDPVYDHLQFDLGFPRGFRPVLVALNKQVKNPFSFEGSPVDEGNEDQSKDTDKDKKKDNKENVKVEVDFDGIETRVMSFPVDLGRYRINSVIGLKGKVLFGRNPVEGMGEFDWRDTDPKPKSQLMAFDFKTQKCEVLVSGYSDCQVSGDRKKALLRVGKKLRVVSAGEKPESKDKEGFNPTAGWIDLSRVRVNVEPKQEWRQMYREAWRLQREHFWVEDMSQVDWNKVYENYLPLLDRVSTRAEFSDLMWEMQGELGTSHSYEFGGDYRYTPKYMIGFLGANFEYSPKNKAYKITRIVKGDPWDERNSSPFLRPGINIEEGDMIYAVGNQSVDQARPLNSMLVHQAGKEVSLLVQGRQDKEKRRVSVKTLRSELLARYRDWVEFNRETVHQQTEGKVGYVHIPNMGPWGFSEFHRYFLTELVYDGLVIDVRYNGGGHVSELLLSKLAKKRIGFVKSRWFGEHPYPEESPAGPMVALTNELAGSDGDIFSHSFKMLGLGPLIGKRTWGGVIGISPSQFLVDGGMTTQPEYSFWFSDVGWKIENFGAEPDIEVDISPQDYVRDDDPQLARGVVEIKRILKEKAPLRPNFEERPNLSLPRGLDL